MALEKLNIVVEAGAKALASTFNKVTAKVDAIIDYAFDVSSKVSSIKNNFDADDYTDELYVTDSNGYVFASITKKDGGYVFNYVGKTDDSKLQEITTLLNHQASCFDADDYADELYITDSNGYVFASITKGDDGNYVLNYVGKTDNGLSLQGYELFSIGDSLSVSGKWQNKVAELTGCTFDSGKNTKAGAQLSTGGTMSWKNGFDTTLWRIKNLVDQGYITGDGENAIIIIENINDIDASTVTDGVITPVTFDKTARTFVPTDPIEVPLGTDFADALKAVSTADRSFNTVFKVNAKTSGKNLAITTMPTSEGDVTLKITTAGAGLLSYGIHVKTTDSLTDILNKILEYNYTTVTDTLASDGKSVDFVGANIVITFSGGSTGMAVSITDTDNACFVWTKLFVGDSLDDFEDESKWLTGYDYNLSMAYRSSIDYLLYKYPKAHVFLSMFPSYSFVPSEFVALNGMIDTAKYSNTDRSLKTEALDSFVNDVASFYGLPILDVYRNCGINPNNYSTYYPSNNVHPLDVGFERIGETVASLLLNYFNK